MIGNLCRLSGSDNRRHCPAYTATLDQNYVYAPRLDYKIPE